MSCSGGYEGADLRVQGSRCLGSTKVLSFGAISQLLGLEAESHGSVSGNFWGSFCGGGLLGFMSIYTGYFLNARPVTVYRPLTVQSVEQ